MITTTNEGTRTTLTTDARHPDKSYIKLIKGITLQPHEVLQLHTGIIVECSSPKEVVFIKCGLEKEDSKVAMISSRITKDDNNSEIIIPIYNASDSELKISAKTTIGRLYKALSLDGTVPVDEISSTLVYKDDVISIHSVVNDVYNYTINTLPDGSRQLIVDLPRENSND